MRSSKTLSEGRKLTTEAQRHSSVTARFNRLCLCVSVVNPYSLYTQLRTATSTGFRQRLRMALFIQQDLLCAPSPLPPPSCVRAGPAANSNANNAPAGSPDAPLLSAAEPITL